MSFAAAGDIVVYNYLKGVWVELDLAGFELLHLHAEWKTAEDVASELPEWQRQDVIDGIRSLLEHDLLLGEDDQYDQGLDEWDRWEDDARFFHFWTRSTFAGATAEEMRRSDDGRWFQVASSLPWAAEIRPQDSPAPFKRYPDAPRIYLPRAFVPLRSPYEESLVARRTHRSFAAAPVGLRELSTLLHLTFGPMYFKDDGDFGILQVRTSAAGGSRHEGECYLGVIDVEGIPRGLYHYCAVDHSLELLQGEFTTEMAVRAAAGQSWVAEAGCIFFFTAVFERMSWKYRMSFAYRAILLNTGFLGQTFALTATALGLAPFQTAATENAEIERWLGIDPFQEGVMLLTACGQQRREDCEGLLFRPMTATKTPLVKDHPLPRPISAPAGVAVYGEPLRTTCHRDGYAVDG